MIDQHLHSSFSPDSNVSIEDYYIMMEDYGNEYLNITDHLDCLDKLKKNDMYDYIINMDNQYKYIKSLGKNIYPGIEVGYNKSTLTKTTEFLSERDFSIILLSIHDNDDREVRYCFATTYKKSVDEIVKMYFDQMYEAVNSGIDYDVLSHIGYIFRYTSGQVNPLDYMVEVEKVLKVIIDQDKAMEINTGCFRRGAYDAPTFYTEVLKLYKSLGGYKISLGSDAHSLVDYCNLFDEVQAFIKSNGFDELTLVKERVHRQVKI